jgi:hypothetical protein
MRTWQLMATVLLLSACDQGSQAPSSENPGPLALVHDDQGLSVSFTGSDGTAMSARCLAAGDDLTLTIEVNALLTLTTRVNRVTRHVDYIVPDGAVLTDRDSRNLNLLYRALLDQFGGIVNLTGLWAERATGALTTLSVDLPPKQSWTSLCDQMYTWVWADHDCQYFGWGGNPKPVNIGPWNTSSIPNYNGTAYGNWVNGGWQYPDQGWAYNSVPTGVGYEWGNCYGECGAGCGSPDYTVDCLNHDHCVRNHGHWIGSGYCDDQFAACSDDSLASWMGGAPNCW